MKKQTILFGILGVTLSVFAVAAVSKIVTSAKSSPEGVAEAPITPENIADRKTALEAVDPADLQRGMTYTGDTNYHDGDGNIYRYDENGKLVGLMKFMGQDEAALPELDEAAIRECAQQYLAGLVADPSRYTFERLEREGGIYSAFFNARCCGFRTTDTVCVMMKPNGTLEGYLMNHTGAFADVTVTEAQITDAIARAEAEASGPKATVTKVAGLDEVTLTYDESGNLVLNVSIVRDLISANGLTFPDPSIRQVPIL